ncbi:hypothetical protein QQS21_005453 [Conoideocrella luteorostrata]|uniref:Uncharacterized protein n=1 Tax=Conoideocrella luteorostrata TaxID=1105319 RepID=A0AAJ0CPH3_9HYPO|nr:hypothetical protein QQS21_005453 [Conoideocrella luteorostrata]
MRFSNLFVLLPAVLAAPLTERSEPAPLIEVQEDVRAKVIPNKYIVMFRNNIEVAQVQGAIGNHSVTADYVFEDVIKGFAGTLDDAAIEALRNRPDVDYIERDTVFSLDCIPLTVQRGAPWGLGRISNRRKGIKFYRFQRSAGAGTCAYIVDTGIDDKHKEFQRRAKQLKSFIEGQPTDGHGHGTHCAGTIGSKTGSGTLSGIIAGLNFVAQDHKKQKCPKGVVVNISLGGPYSRASNEAVAALVRSGAFVAVAAGNGRQDAARTSPASEHSACTVGASDINDNFAGFSNFGKSVSVIAPGVEVLSTIPGGRTATLTGTSMASPHIAGLAAYLGAKENIQGGNVCRRIQQLALRGTVRTVPRGTVNALAFNGAGSNC